MDSTSVTSRFIELFKKQALKTKIVKPKQKFRLSTAKNNEFQLKYDDAVTYFSLASKDIGKERIQKAAK